MVRRFLLAASDEHDRVDKVLARRLGDVSRASIQRWIREGRVLVDGKLCSPKDEVGPGSELVVDPGPAPLSSVDPEEGVEFTVVFEDDELIVVDKPAGVVVHPGKGHWTGTLVAGLLARPGFGRPPSDERDPEGAFRPGVVHRIDKDTSGVLVVAKTASAREALKEQFAAHSVERSYLALTLGVPEEGRIGTQYGRNPRSRVKFTSKLKEGKSAVTHVRLLESLAGGRAAFVECRLETGRTHQVRVHLAEQRRTPLLADALYGRASADPILARAAELIGRHALHAHTLAFQHPARAERMAFSSPLPAAMEATLQWLRQGSARS